jgi:hypothetical protein
MKAQTNLPKNKQTNMKSKTAFQTNMPQPDIRTFPTTDHRTSKASKEKTTKHEQTNQKRKARLFENNKRINTKKNVSSVHTWQASTRTFPTTTHLTPKATQARKQNVSKQTTNSRPDISKQQKKQTESKTFVEAHKQQTQNKTFFSFFLFFFHQWQAKLFREQTANQKPRKKQTKNKTEQRNNNSRPAALNKT